MKLLSSFVLISLMLTSFPLNGPNRVSFRMVVCLQSTAWWMTPAKAAFTSSKPVYKTEHRVMDDASKGSLYQLQTCIQTEHRVVNDVSKGSLSQLQTCIQNRAPRGEWHQQRQPLPAPNLYTKQSIAWWMTPAKAAFTSSKPVYKTEPSTMFNLCLWQ